MKAIEVCPSTLMSGGAPQEGVVPGCVPQDMPVVQCRFG